MPNYFIVLVTACLILGHSTVVAQGRPPAVVSAHTVESKTIRSHAEALGNLKANDSVEVSVNVTETISVINFNDGEMVEKGQVLVELTSAEEKALLVEAEAAVTESKRQLKRVSKLVNEGNASHSLLDERQRNYDSAQARLIATKARFDDRIVTAPFAGRVGLREVSLGALVSPGAKITTLTDNHQMKLDFSVPAILLAKIKVGLPIEAKTVAYKAEVFEGQIASIDNQIDPVTRSFKVRAILPNDQGLLKQGMLMTVDLFYNERVAIVVPEHVVIQDAQNNYVMLIEQQDEKLITQKRQVTTGERFKGEVEITGGLEVGERVVLDGAFKTSPGSEIKILEESGSP